MIVSHRLTLEGPEGGRIDVSVAHNDKPGCVFEAGEVWTQILAALVTNTTDLIVKRQGSAT